MSGRRRRDDGWDDGHHNAQEERRDPWGVMDPGSAHEPGWRPSVVEAAWSNASDAGRRAGGYESARNAGDRYVAGPGNGGQRERGAASGHSATGYSGNGYQDSGYGRVGNGGSRRDAAGYGAAPGGQWNGSGYGASGRPGGPAPAPEFMPADRVDLAVDGPAGTPRPYGRLSIYTLHEDKTREFDRLAERAAEGVRAAEPDTLVYVIHVVPKAPMQRIIYEIYRDRAAFLTHERQPHIRKFVADSASCVLATNIIDLRLKYAKVAALNPAAESPMPPPASRVPRTPEPAAGSDRYQSAGAQYQAAQHQPTQYSAAPQPGAASFTPAKDQYADAGQPTVGREAFRPATQYGAGSANGGSYSGASSYQSPNGSSAGNGYGGSGYANGADYSAANRYSNGGSDQNGSGYDEAGGPGSNGAAPKGPQYTPRYRELTSGASPDAGAGGYPGNGSRDPDSGKPNRPQPTEWASRPQDQR
jgi:quinol monooxygenase YgiN